MRLYSETKEGEIESLLEAFSAAIFGVCRFLEIRTMKKRIVGCAVAALALAATPVWAQGTFLRGVGAVNESMGGAAVAAPLDAAGAIYWNPAAISGLNSNQMSIDLGLIMPNSTVESAAADKTTNYGKAESEAGQIPAPTMAMTWRPKTSPRVTTGIMIGAVGGAAALYPSTGTLTDNPILGGDAKAANVQVLQVVPTISYQITNRVSIGLSPVLTLAQASINPMALGMPPTDHLSNYGTRYTWGGGLNAGIYYEINNNWRAGFSVKSPIWSDALRFVGENKAGTPRRASMQLDLPMVLSWGLSYDGFRDTVIGADIRYFNWAGTDGFKGSVVQGPAPGTVRSLGWNDSMSLALGVQRKIGQRFVGRMGYTFSTNPIPAESQWANVGSPLMIEHVIALGGTFVIVRGLELNAAYTHAFENSREGNAPAALGRMWVKNTVSANTLIAGITKKW
ncbi:MAG: OmpP1/FadL family transporter [Thermoguttaceae bacterium]